ncbi:hypothetical protein C7974DRAFT_397653 [Boeremia exigua]|uniref:uncharacterized protein n=1 Tax=Boeremia exigua TaxID=749465 RepID=UPI001E8E6BF6|nr:uncharacterized protein C7974DRAFT_397653 [Boeremia exigua]KAH6622091.1 hypothetical protein C7974DRAFT_397653 [Boeremia exigua]
MEPFSALAVATATCQFLDFTSGIMSGTWKIYNTNAGHGVTSRMLSITVHISTLKNSCPQKSNASYLSDSGGVKFCFEDLRRSSPGFAPRLISHVCQKSEGVFLWVRLATSSLLGELTEGESASDLQMRLNDSLLIARFFLIKSLTGWMPGTQIVLDMCPAAEENPNYAIEAAQDQMSHEQALGWLTWLRLPKSDSYIVLSKTVFKQQFVLVHTPSDEAERVEAYGHHDYSGNTNDNHCE